VEILSIYLGPEGVVMAVEIKSKRAVVSKAPYELYMAFVDMRNFLQFVPEDKREGVTADYDTIHATVQGFNIGVKVVERTPYSKIEFADDGAPFQFRLVMHFDPAHDPYRTDFQICLDADLNFMMKTLLGGKLKDALDKVVDGLVAVSEGRMPEGFDPSMMK
jgi:hypothetical protein